jgi:hypothetical protein
MNSRLKLGVIGLSEGNGHPYSWAAIFNGYDPKEMQRCGFPAIPQYLAKQKWPEAVITGALVTDVWTQDRRLSERVAKAARIPNVVENFTDMIGKVDGLLLARDDAETHLKFAGPYLEAGIPVYVDKPLALTVAEAQRLFDLEHYPGQLFTCSALRYAKEFHLSAQVRTEIGGIRYIHATAPKDWDRYAVHVVEPMLALAGEVGAIRRAHAWHEADATVVSLVWESGFRATVSTMGALPAPLALRVFGQNGWRELVFEDTFSAFRAALSEFVQAIRRRDIRIPHASVLDIVRVIEAGRKT